MNENRLKSRLVTLSLDDNTIKILDDFKWDLKTTKSNIIRKILYFFNDNPEKLEEILND